MSIDFFGHMRSVTCGRKICTSPHHKGPRWLPLVYFNASEWFEGKEFLKRAQPYCQACQRIDVRIRQGVKRTGKPFNPRKERGKYGLKSKHVGGYIAETEEEKEILRKMWRDKYHRASPEAKQKRREYQARWYREHRAKRREEDKDFFLPAGPFIEWLERKRELFDTLHEMDAVLGINASEVLARRPVKVSFDTVDTALTNEDTTGMWELYPDGADTKAA